MNVNFNGYGENIVTFIADEKLTQAGVPVKISANGTVAPCESDDNRLCGVCINVRDGYAAVQLGGYVRLPLLGDGALGYQNIKPVNDGKVAIDTTGKEYLVVDFDSEYIGFIL